MEKAKESVRQRNERIKGTNNGVTLRTRVITDKKKYNRAKMKKEKPE